MIYNFNELRFDLKKDINYSNEKDIKSLIEEIKKWCLKYNCKYFTHYIIPFDKQIGLKYSLIDELDSKCFIKEEVDASSFETGDLKKCNNAKGYCLIDKESSLFIIDDILYIPSFFVSYDGLALDYKDGLIKSQIALKKASEKLFDAIGYKNKFLIPYVGLEQEFFLLDKDLAKKRKDLTLANRTLFGGETLFNIEIKRHYFTKFTPRIKKYFDEVNEYLHALGIKVKSFHTEVAFNQFEIALLYNNTYKAIEENQILQLVLKHVANKHNLACIFDEKPFIKQNGSGKHNNYSLITNDNINVFDINNTEDNLIKKLFIGLFLKTINKNKNNLLTYILDENNLDRLGGYEAPPASISVYLPSDYEDYLYRNKTFNYERNRTSPIAFCANKFEFRGVGASSSTYELNKYLNLIIADEINSLTKKLNNSFDIEKIAISLYRKNKAIIYNGDCYKKEYKEYLESINFKENDYIKILNENNKEMKKLFEKYNIKNYETMINIKYKKFYLMNILHLKILKSMCLEYFMPLLKKEMSNLYNMLNEIILILDKEINHVTLLADYKTKAIYINEKILELKKNLIINMNKCENMFLRQELSYPLYDELLKEIE